MRNDYSIGALYGMHYPFSWLEQNYRDCILGALKRHISRSAGKVRVLDKGAGDGTFSATMRASLGWWQRRRISITSLGLTRSISKENRHAIDRELIGIGLTKQHTSRYHIIIDRLGEDYHLPRTLWEKSIRKSLSLLEDNGDFFTIVGRNSETRHSKEELRVFGEALASEGYSIEFLGNNKFDYLMHCHKGGTGVHFQE